MSKVDLLQKPETSWLEDKDGNRINDSSFDLKEGQYKHYKFIEMHERIYTKRPKTSWLKSKIARIFHLEYNTSGLLMECVTSGNAITPIVKEMLNKGWQMSDAAIVAHELCEGCLNTVLSEIEGWEYNEDPRTSCKHCEVIRQVAV